MPLPTIIALTALPCGWLLQRQGRFSPLWQQRISRLLIQLCYPALILVALSTRIEANELRELWILPAALAGLLLLGEALGKFLLRYSGLESPTEQRSFVFLAILPNYSYLPLLVAQSLWGERGMALVILSSVGADLVLWTHSVGVLRTAAERAGLWSRLRRLLSPPLLSLVCGLFLLTEAGAPLKTWLAPLLPWLGKIGLLTLPLSMLLLGSHLGRPRSSKRVEAKAQGLLLAWRLLLVPTFVSLLLTLWPRPLPAPAPAVLLTISTMPGAIVSVILSEAYAGSPDFAARHVLWGHLCWLLSGPAWLYWSR